MVQASRAVNTNRKLALITAAITLVIIYGSLYPFEFFYNKDDPFRALLSTRFTLSGRGDILSNILLYLPFGFFAVQTVRKRPPFLRIALAFCAGIILSTAIEITQFYDAGRESAMSDIYANAAGTLIGALAGGVFTSKLEFPFLAGLQKRPFVLMLLVCWLGYRLFPFVPAIDLHKYWDAVKPLVQDPQLLILQTLRHLAAWLAVAALLEVLIGTAKSRFALPLLFAGVLFGRVMIVGIVLSPGEVVGGVVSAGAWALLLSRLSLRPVIIAAFFTGMLVAQGLSPFEFSSKAASFSWIPFGSLMDSSIEMASRSFLEKVFAYGALIWLAVRAGCPWVVATPAGAALLLGIEICQIYIPGHSAEITDPLILLIVAGIMELMSEHASRPAPAPLELQAQAGPERSRA